MKLRVSTCVLLFLGLIFSGCVSATQMAQPTQVTHPSVATIFATPTFVRMAPSSIPYLPIGTLKPELSQIVISTNTPIPSNTLEPQKAHEVIAALLQEAIDCSAPCFWGIVPGQTSPVDALSKFNHLGIQAQIISLKDKDLYNFDYDLNSGFSISIVLPIEHNLVETITVTLVPNLQKLNGIHEWLAYSPQTLIKRYGSPSGVDFVADWGPAPLFAMQMYFESVDLTIQYAGDNLLPNKKSSFQYCPLTTQYSSIRIWMGKNPLHPPGKGVPLEKATSLTIEEFSKLLALNPDYACFTIDGNVFR